MRQACSNLFCSGRRENCASNASRQETSPNIAREARFMTGTTAADQGDFLVRKSNRGWMAIDDFVMFIEQERRIRKSERSQGGQYSMTGIVEEVFSYGEKTSVDGHQSRYLSSAATHQTSWSVSLSSQIIQHRCHRIVSAICS